MSAAVQTLIDQLTAIQWITIGFVLVLAINGLATMLESLRKIHAFARDLLAHFKGKRLSDAELKTQVLAVSKRLMDFVQERQANEPAFSFNTFEESSNALIRHSQESQNLYARDFAGEVSNLRDELIKRKLQDKELDQFFEHPTNHIGLRILAVKLAALGEKLRGG
jgi:hypothetical protein